MCTEYRFRIEYFVVIDAKRFTMIYNKVNEEEWIVHFLMFFFSLQCSTLIFANGFNGANTWHTFHLKVINPVTINYHRGKCNVVNIMCVVCCIISSIHFKWLNFHSRHNQIGLFILFELCCWTTKKEQMNEWMNASVGLSLFYIVKYLSERILQKYEILFILFYKTLFS